MRSKKIFSLIIIIVVSYLTCSCVRGGKDLNIEISPLDKNLVDLSTKIYEDNQLLELTKFEGTLNQFNTKYPIECLRKNGDFYRASYLGNESVAIVLFDNSYNKITGKIYSTALYKSEFERLEKGQLLSDVMIIDPDGEYMFLYAGRNDIPKVSTHYTKDGYLITVEYDDSNTIVSISEELI